MSKIKAAFQSGKAFIPFVTCGDPSLDVTEQIVYAMADAGADLIELGIPFSDPTAEKSRRCGQKCWRAARSPGFCAAGGWQPRRQHCVWWPQGP